MNKNKIAGLVLAGAIISSASTGATSSIISSPIKTKTSTKNEKLLVADQSTQMDSTAVVVNGDNSLVLKNKVNGAIVSYLSAGEMLHVTSKVGSYYKVTVEETGATGFISANNVELILNGENSNFVSLNENGHVINVSSEVHLRGKASLNSNIIGFLKNGDSFKILGKEGQWYKVNSNGHIGFIFEEYVAKDNDNISVDMPASTSVHNDKIVNKSTNNTVNNSKGHSSNILNNTMTENKMIKDNKVSTMKSSISNNNTVTTNNTNDNVIKKVVSHNNNVPKKNNNEKNSAAHLINNANSETGTATIKLINTNTSIPLANTSVSINDKVLTTNSKGEVNLIKLKPGQATLNISSSNYNATTLKLDVIANKNTDATVRLTPDNGTALLTFLNAGNSRSIANINVSIDGTTYTTNSKGEILLKDLEPGNHTLSVSAKGFNDTTVKVNITPDGKVVGNVNLYPKENLISLISLNQNINKKVNVSSKTNTNTQKVVKETENKAVKETNNTSNKANVNAENSKANNTVENNKTLENHASINTDNKTKNNTIIKNKDNITKNTNNIDNNSKKDTNTINTKQHNSNKSINNKEKTNSSTTNIDNNKESNKINTNSKEHIENNNNNTVSTNNKNSISNDAPSKHISANHVVNTNSNNNSTNSNSNNNVKKDNHIVNTNVPSKHTSVNHTVNTNNNSNSNNNNNNSNSNNHIVSNNSNSNNKNTSPKKQQNISSNNNESTAQLQQAIVKYAEQFLGRPYVWGATGPNAFDCSGLTSYVYRHFGYNIGRTTYQQIDAGTPVSLNDLEPGDLLFFGNPEAPDHVVMYIGNHQYIQAPQPGQYVDISSWNWGGIVAARRIV